MRVFLSCQQALRPHAVPAYSFWEFYFRNALIEAGHEIVEAPDVDWAEGLTSMTAEERSAWLDHTWSRTIEFIREEHKRRPIQLFLSYLFPQQSDESAVATISGLGIPTVNFFCDNIRELVRVPDSYRKFDLHWVPEHDAREIYRTAGLKFILAPMPVWIAPENRRTPTIENTNVVFVGSVDDLREDLLGRAAQKGLALSIIGPGWRNAGESQQPANRSLARKLVNQSSFVRAEGLRGILMRATYQIRRRPDFEWGETVFYSAISSEGYFNTMRESRIVLGINRCPSFRRPFWNPIKYSRLRDIEAPMLGACYLTEMAPGLDQLYEIGSEIETYSDADELVTKAAELGADSARRQRLRLRGQSRALNEHSISRTIGLIAARLGVEAAHKG